MTRFFGREVELMRLTELLHKSSSSLVVLRGRRRIGKSRLAEEFAKKFERAYFFTGLPPSKNQTAKDQYAEFRRQMLEYHIGSGKFEDWGDLFSLVAKQCQMGQVLIVLDEITWMGSKDPNFLGKLKIAWDLYFKKNPKLVLIISGSNSVWIEENILSSTGFMGRVSLQLVLEELPLYICNKFWGSRKDLVSSYEKFKILGVTGGVPRYLEEILPNQTAEENIFRLCFAKSGILFAEFDHIFKDLFTIRHKKYEAIVQALAGGSASLEEIATHLDRIKGGDLSQALKDLEESGFLARDYSWNIKDGKISKLSRYRLRDNYLRFYLKYVAPNKSRIENETLKALPVAWLTIMGLQFENLVFNNRNRIIELLHIPAHEVVAVGSYFQTETLQRQGCQIDLMLQTKYGQLYVCEIKFAKSEIGKEVVHEVKKKIDALDRPKGFSCRPVLIHVNGVSDSVVETEFFSKIIDFSELLDDAQ